MGDVLTVGDAARVLGVSSEYVRRLCDQKKLPSVRTDRGHRLIPRSAVLRLKGKRPRRGMIAAVKSGSVVIDGERHTVTAGTTVIDAAHEIVRQRPDLFDLSVAPAPTRNQATTTTKARSAPVATRSKEPLELWFAKPRSVAWDDLTHEQQQSIRKTCRHEAAHAVLALRLGWHVGYIEARAAGGGEAYVIAPKGLSKAEHKRQLALVSAMGALGSGWQPRERARHGNSKDDATIEEAARYLGGGRWGDVVAEIRAEAARIFNEPTFQRDVDTLTRALLSDDGRLEGDDVRRLLRRRTAA